MSLFELIMQRKFQEFCAAYEAHAEAQSRNPEYADLMPGNYRLALLGSRQYEKLAAVCQAEIAGNEARQKGPDRSSSDVYIHYSIAKMELGQEDAIETVYAGRKANYQDLSRTEVPCVMYYEAVMLGDEKGRKESMKLLKTRLKSKGSEGPEFAVARFLTGGCGAQEMLGELEGLDPVLRERYLGKARFYLAVKAFEAGDMEQYRNYLQAVDELYQTCPTIVIEMEYHLAQICRSKAAHSDNREP